MSVPQLSYTLANGRLAALDVAFMRKYFQSRLRRWFGGNELLHLRIHDKSHALYKKSIAYHLVFTAASGVRERRTIRGNIPSLDTTEEARIADQAMRIIWRLPAGEEQGSIPRPLGFDEQLRMLLYLAVPGEPLMKLLRRRDNQTEWFLRRSGIWLRWFHDQKIQRGRSRTFAFERREARYFSMNYRGLFPTVLPITSRMLEEFFSYRQRLRVPIERSRVLLHGDFNPNNIIVDTSTRKMSVIDFGNAWLYDPMSDVANAIVQLGYITNADPRRIRHLQRLFLSSYNLTSKSPRHAFARYSLFLLWWSLQTLSFTMTLPMTTAHNLKPVITRTQRTCDEALLFLRRNI